MSADLCTDEVDVVLSGAESGLPPRCCCVVGVDVDVVVIDCLGFVFVHLKAANRGYPM